MVTATTMTARFKGVSGNDYFLSGYISDVINGIVTWNPQGIAVTGGPAFTTFRERVELQDLSILTGPTVMTVLVPTANENILQNSALPIANFLSTIQSRPELHIKFELGTRISFVQK